MSHPANWKALQNNVCQILTECGYQANTPKKLNSTRGKVEVDVYAVDNNSYPMITYICECKNWNRRVRQDVVFSFRTIVNDIGADVGIIISLKGFQSGAIKTAKNTNIRLLSWEDFQKTFLIRWYNTYFIPRIYEISRQFIAYTEPINSHIKRKADNLENEKFKKFISLRKKYETLSFLILGLYTLSYKNATPPVLPLNTKYFKDIASDSPFLNEILNATNFRSILEALKNAVEEATCEFNNIFDERV